MIASIRARCRRAATYLAAPAARKSSSAASVCGIATALNVATRPATNSNSTSEYPAATSDLRCLELRLMIVVGLRRRDRQVAFQLEEVLLADTADVHQLLDLLERSVLLPVLDDPFRGLRADAGKRLQLGDRCRVDVDGSCNGRLCRRPAALAALRCGELRLHGSERGDGDNRQNGAQHRQSSFWVRALAV